MSYIPSKKAKKLVDKAIRLVNIKNFNKALEKLEAAVQIYPNYNDAWTVMGLIYWHLKDYNNTIRAYIKALETFDQSAKTNRYHPGILLDNLTPIWFNLGRSYWEGLNRASNALFCFKKAFNLKADKNVKDYIDKCLKKHPSIEPKIPTEIEVVLPSLVNSQKILKKFFEDLIKFIKPYDKVSIDTIAEHFFPASVSYADYRRSEPEMRRAMRQGFTPEPSFFRTSQIVSEGLKTMHTVINSLIEQGVINGFIRPIGNQSYFINSGESIDNLPRKELSPAEIKELNEEWFAKPAKLTNFRPEKIIAASEIQINKQIYEINQEDLINYVNNYDKVSIPKIAEHFFPAPLSYYHYYISRSQGSMGFTTEKFAKTAQIVESAIETITINLKKLIEQNNLQGKIEQNPHGFGSYFINEKKMEEKRKEEESIAQKRKEEEEEALKNKLLKVKELIQEEKISDIFSELTPLIKEAISGHFDEFTKMVEEVLREILLKIETHIQEEKKSDVVKDLNNFLRFIGRYRRKFDSLKKPVEDLIKKANDIEFNHMCKELEALVDEYNLAKIFQITNITDAGKFLTERNKLSSELIQLYRQFEKTDEFRSKIINLAIKFFSKYVDFNPFIVEVQYFASIYSPHKKSIMDVLQSQWKESVKLQDLARKISELDNESLINQQLEKIAEEIRTLTYNVPIENMYNFLLDFSQIIPDPQISKIQGATEDEYTLKTQMGNLYFKIIEKEQSKKLTYQYDFLTGTWGEKGTLFITFDEPSSGSVTLKVRNDIQEISQNNIENLTINNILGTFLKTYLDFNLGKVVAKQVQTIFYEKSFDDLTLGNYRVLQAKFNALGKDINELQARFFEVKSPLTLNSFECSECGATLNITSKEEKFIICDHCSTPFLMEWQKD